MAAGQPPLRGHRSFSARSDVPALHPGAEEGAQQHPRVLQGTWQGQDGGPWRNGAYSGAGISSQVVWSKLE